MVADQLSKQHKFEDAERWLRYIFDPTSGEPGTDAKRFLKFRVFREMNLNNQVINDLKVLAQAASGLATDKDIDAVKKLINRWREMPFRPFVIARGRQIAFLWRTLQRAGSFRRELYDLLSCLATIGCRRHARLAQRIDERACIG